MRPGGSGGDQGRGRRLPSSRRRASGGSWSLGARFAAWSGRRRGSVPQARGRARANFSEGRIRRRRACLRRRNRRQESLKSSAAYVGASAARPESSRKTRSASPPPRRIRRGGGQFPIKPCYPSTGASIPFSRQSCRRYSRRPRHPIPGNRHPSTTRRQFPTRRSGRKTARCMLRRAGL